MYKYVFFDMDGTVLDTLQDLTDAVNHTLRQYGYPEISRVQCAANLGNGARVLLTRSAPAEADIDEMLKSYMPYYNAHCLDKTVPFEGIPELMHALKDRNVRMAIISNKPDAATRELAAQFFGDLLDFAVGESEAVKKKPDPSLVNAAIREFGAEREDCVYIGDTEVDIKTAKNACIDCIAVTWGFRTEQELIDSGATVLAKNADELLKLLT